MGNKQAPIPRQGNMIKKEWLQRYAYTHPRVWYDCVIQSWDTASEASQLNDYSVCVTVGLRDGKTYLLDVFRQKLEFPELLETAQQLAIEHQANIVLVEKASSGNSLAQVLRNRLNCTIRPITPQGDKQMRLLNVSYMFENGHFKLPNDASWLQVFEQELLGFPSVKHDDQVDAISQLLGWLKDKKVENLKYGSDGVKARPRPKRRPGSRRPRIGPRAEPIKIFGS